MKNHIGMIDMEQLGEAVDELTEENQRYFLGVLEALSFAQSAGEKSEPKNANTGIQGYTD